MTRYQVSQKVVYEDIYEVDAESAAEAAKEVINGGGDLITTEYSHVDDISYYGGIRTVFNLETKTEEIVDPETEEDLFPTEDIDESK
jgi:hypothetical protein